MKRAVVISLGGSLIAPEKMNYSFLKKFRTVLSKHYKKNSFIVVCGGGVVARKYISVLRKDHKSEKEQSLAGIKATCMNASFMVELFGKDANERLPRSMKEAKNLLKKNNVVFCCAFRYIPHTTSDLTAAELARYVGGDLINLSNVDELYTTDPNKNKKAKPIPYESWKDFEKRALQIPYKAGQHFILDQKAARFIRKHQIKTYLLGNKLENLSKLLEEKKFKGTTIGP